MRALKASTASFQPVCVSCLLLQELAGGRGDAGGDDPPDPENLPSNDQAAAAIWAVRLLSHQLDKARILSPSTWAAVLAMGNLWEINVLPSINHQTSRYSKRLDENHHRAAKQTLGSICGLPQGGLLVPAQAAATSDAGLRLSTLFHDANDSTVKRAMVTVCCFCPGLLL